jgi:hypothetical protein
MKQHACGILTAIALAASDLAAEARSPIVTDRPDIAESSETVGHGVYQLEQAAQYDASGGIGALSFPSLHRVGLGDRFELRMETPLVNIQNGVPAFDELAVGGKLHVVDGGGLGEWPSVALLAHAALTQGGGIEPIAKVLIDTTLPLDFELGFNAGATLPSGSAGPTGTFTSALSHDLVESLRSYVELSGERNFAGAQDVLGLDGGLVYLVNDDLQLDVAVYRGLTAAATEWYVTTGVSARWGKR